MNILPIIDGIRQTVNKEMNLSEDDHSKSQEKTRGSKLCCDTDNVTIVITSCHNDGGSSK